MNSTEAEAAAYADYAALSDHDLLAIIARESMMQTAALVRIAAGLEEARNRFTPKLGMRLGR